jgi:hypothetical protein
MYCADDSSEAISSAATQHCGEGHVAARCHVLSRTVAQAQIMRLPHITRTHVDLLHLHIRAARSNSMRYLPKSSCDYKERLNILLFAFNSR